MGMAENLSIVKPKKLRTSFGEQQHHRRRCRRRHRRCPLSAIGDLFRFCLFIVSNVHRLWILIAELLHFLCARMVINLHLHFQHSQRPPLDAIETTAETTDTSD